MLNRRLFIAGATGTALAAPAIVRAQSWFSAYPFKLGVAAGDPSSDGFVIWTKLAPEPYAPHGGMPMSLLQVKWEVASDDRFRTIVAAGEAPARPELGHSVHVEVSGLQAGTTYWYRFSIGSDRSLFGRAKTLPAAGSAANRLRFAIAGCQHYESGLYTAYRAMAGDDLDFVYHYGDFIYEYSPDYNFGAGGLPVPKIREHRLREVYSLDDYRAHYAQHLLDLDLQAARARHAFISTFDDHEIHNNWVQDISQDRDIPNQVFALRRAAAMQAWYEFMPVRAALFPDGRVINAHRRFNWGTLAAINVLDTRSWRSDQPCDDGFKPICAGVNDPEATVLGQAQEQWLDASFARRDATWTCVAQQIMMMPLDRRDGGRTQGPEKIINIDSWAGYDAARRRMMRRFSRLDNVVVLTGDEHQNFAGQLFDGDRPVAMENVITSISSGGDGRDLRNGADVLMAANPQVKFMNDQRGYGVCEVTPDAWQTHYMVLDRVSSPGGTISRRATATMARGSTNVTIS